MRVVLMADIVLFAKKWLQAGPHIVQHWNAWEAKAGEFFGAKYSPDDDVFHGVMTVVCCVCFGDASEVKMGMRAATPSVLKMCTELFQHLQQFSVVVEAEVRFRARQLAADWMLYLKDGKMVVRSEYRRGWETEH